METATSASLFNQITLPLLPLHWTLVLLAVLLPTAVILGHRAGVFRRGRLVAQGKADEASGSDTAVGAILALLGLLLAFSFGNALSTSQATKSAITSEAAALGTVFLRADYLPEPGRTNLQVAILDYTKTRLTPRDTPMHSLAVVQAFVDKSLRAQAKLWPLMLEATTDPSVEPPIKAFVAGAMNEALDAHLYRMETLALPVSEVSQTMMLIAAVVSLFLVGNQAGIEGRSLNWRSFVLAAILFVVMATILDTQRTNEGLIRIDVSALHATIFDMEQALKGRI
jgi:hypothetical protein